MNIDSREYVTITNLLRFYEAIEREKEFNVHKNIFKNIKYICLDKKLKMIQSMLIILNINLRLKLIS